MLARHLLKPFAALCLVALGACQGGGCSGGANPLQPSSGATVFYYHSSFDAQANVNEWLTYKRGGTGLIGDFLDSTEFQSSPHSLGVSVTGSVFGDSLVYTEAVFQPSKDLWLEFDWLLLGMSGENEVVLNLGSVNRASIGYNASGIYLTNNGVRTYMLQNLSTAAWHHVRLLVSGGSNLSSYWLDGAKIGTNESTALSPVGGPAVDYVGIKLLFNPGDVVRVDNVQAYHL
jgi:hypothetical protein